MTKKFDSSHDRTCKIVELEIWNALQSYDYYTSTKCEREMPEKHFSRLDEERRKKLFLAYHNLRSRWSKFADYMFENQIGKDCSYKRLENYQSANKDNVLLYIELINVFEKYEAL